MPSPAKSPVKYSDPSGWRDEVCIYRWWPFWFDICLILLLSHMLHDLSYEEDKNIEPVWWKWRELTRSLCAWTFILFWCGRVESKVHINMSPVFVPVMMFGAKDGIEPMEGCIQTSQTLSTPLSPVTWFQSVIVPGLPHTIPSPLPPTVT